MSPDTTTRVRQPGVPAQNLAVEQPATEARHATAIDLPDRPPTSIKFCTVTQSQQTGLRGYANIVMANRTEL
jgi:hypothetical protein